MFLVVDNDTVYYTTDDFNILSNKFSLDLWVKLYELMVVKEFVKILLTNPT